MDDRKDFGTLDHSRLASATAGGLYGPSAVAAAAAAAVNSGLMQLPSLADTAGRLGVMEGCPGLTPTFGCPPGLHVDYPGGAISAIGSLAQLRGWYGPGAQSQGSSYSDLFGAYAGPGGNWRSLSTPPAPDHFHSPLPGMTHPMWPCPPTPVPCSDGCSLSYCNPPNIYSAYSAYFSSLMSGPGSASGEYPPYLSPRLPGPPPIPSYQQRLHDMHKAYLLSNSAGGHATSEFPSHWNPYLAGSLAVAPPLPSPGYMSSVGPVGYGFNGGGGDTSSTSSRCMSVEEQKQSIKQEPLSNKMKTKDVSADHRPRDAARRDQHRLWERSSVSRQESIVTESKSGLVTTKKVMKAEKLASPIASHDCSLDLCNNNNNNNNHDKKQHHVNGSSDLLRPNADLQSTGDVRTAETTENLMNLVDLKPHVKNLQSLEYQNNNDADDGRNSRLSQASSSCEKNALNGSRKAMISRDQMMTMTPEPNCCNDLHETKPTIDVSSFSLSVGSTKNRSESGSSISHTDEEPVQESTSTGSLSVADLNGISKIDVELTESSSVSTADTSAAGSSDNAASVSVTTSVTDDDLSHDVDSKSVVGSSVNPSDNKPAEECTPCIIQHSLYFEEISNDGIENDGKTDAEEGECDQAEEEKLSGGLRHNDDDVTAATASITPLAKICENSNDNSQPASLNTKTESNHLASPLPVPFPLPSSASLSFVSLSSPPLSSSLSSASVSMSSPSMSSSTTTSSDGSAISAAAAAAASLKVPLVMKNDAQNIPPSPLQPTALTLYVDGSVKPPKTSALEGVNCASGQEIDLAMPRQSMRYQVSHQRHNPMQDGCKVHAPTFLPEVCTLLSNAVTTITVSSSGGSPSSLRSASTGRNGNPTAPTSKTVNSQRPGARSATKSRNCSGQNVTDISIKTDKQTKLFSADSSSPIECKEAVSSGKSLMTSIVSNASGRTHVLDRGATSSDKPVMQMDISVSKAWSQSIVGGSLFGSGVPSNYFTCLSSSSGGQFSSSSSSGQFSSSSVGQYSMMTDRRPSIRCPASQFTIAHMTMPSALASASAKCAGVGGGGHNVEVRDLPSIVPIMSHGVAAASSSVTIRNVDDPLSARSLTSVRSATDSSSSSSSSSISKMWDDSSVPENLSTKPPAAAAVAVSESDAEMATSEFMKRQLMVKPALLSSLGRDGLPVSRHTANSQVDGSSGNNIPVGIARALQRTIPHPPAAASVCSSEDAAAHVSPDVALISSDIRASTTDGKSDNASLNGIPSSNECNGEKTGVRCAGSSQVTSSESGTGTASSDKQHASWKNDLETRSPLFPTSFNRTWLPTGARPPTHPASINPTTLWMGQFPFHPGALLPYSTGSIDRSQSQHLFHPTGGYKLAQDSITGQFFFIPVPDMPWPNLGARHVFQDATTTMQQLSNKDKESSICATVAADDSSPPSQLNRVRSEEVRGGSDVTSSSSTATQAAVHLSNDVSTSQNSDLSTGNSSNNCLPSKMDHHSIPDGAVDISPLGQYPIVYPAARPPYFFCDSNLFVHESNKQKEKARISVESRGTSPILPLTESDLSECSLNKSSLEEKERSTGGAKSEAENHEKTTLNAAVQTNQSASSLPQSPVKAFTAEISIQTSDLSDSDDSDVSSSAAAKQKPKVSKLKRQASLCNKIIRSKDAKKYDEETGPNPKAEHPHTGLVIRTTRDPALSDITSDEDECDSKGISTSHGRLSERLLDREATLEVQKKPEISLCRMDQSLQEIQSNSLVMSHHPESKQPDKRDAAGSGLSDLIQAATTEFGQSCGTDNRPSVETLLTLLDVESGATQALDGLLMLSTIASKHTPTAVAEIPQKTTGAVAESNAGCASLVQKFSILDLPISLLIEAERSPDVNASYNVPKTTCFFDATEFAADSHDCMRRQSIIGGEPATEDLKSGILKSDEGPENMDPMELDLRMRMAEVQMKYKQEQKELARLQRKSSESLRNNSSSQKRKKTTKSVSKQTLQKKSSTSSKHVSSSSDTSSDSSSDDEEPNPKFSRKTSKSKSKEVKYTPSMNAVVSNMTEDVNGIKIKVSNPLRRASSASVSSSSLQFQKKSVSLKKDRRISKDSSDSGKDSLRVKQFERLSRTEESDGEFNPVFDKPLSAHYNTPEDGSGRMSEMSKRKPDQPRKFNSVTDEMMLQKKFSFYNYKKSKSSPSAATLNSLDKDIKKHKFRLADSKKSTKEKHLTKSETESHKTADDWYRRRSERIFLHEASVGSVSSPPGTTSSQISGLDDRSLPSSPTKTVSKPRSLSQDVTPRSHTASSLKSELSVSVKSCTPMTSEILSTKKLLMSSDSSGSDSNSESDSDTDNAPLSTLVQKECTTGLKSCTIGKDELTDGLRVLYLKDGLFFEGTVKAIQPPDVYRISIDGERSSRQEIVSQEQVLERAILNVRPTSKDQLSEGSRICAYWSPKFSFLHPGTVKILGDGFDSDDDDETAVNVEFDDGDTGKIPLAHISMLPPGYQIQESCHPPLLQVSRKRRNTTDEPEAEQLPRPSPVNRSLSVGEPSAKYHPSERTSQMLGSSVRPKPCGKSETRRSSTSQEQRGKKETQEYSCRLKTDGGVVVGKPAAAVEIGLISSKKPSQRGGSVERCERDGNRERGGDHSAADDQRNSHLTLTIKRKQSTDKETSSSVDEGDDNGSSSDDEMPRSHRYHERRKRSMRLERIESRSASDSDETTAVEAAKRKGGQKRKRQSSNKSSKSRKRHHSSSSESGDQIGAFRPVWEQWQWYGPCTRRPGMKGRAKKQFYRAIQRGNEILKLGEAAVFVSMGHNDLQYVGRIDSLWESWDGNMVVKVKWYYHPEETKGGKRLHEIKSALYQSSHEDENDVQTVSHKCEVLSYTNFKKFQAKKYHVDCKAEDVFYLAGTYDPTISMIEYEPDVPLNSH